MAENRWDKFWSDAASRANGLANEIGTVGHQALARGGAALDYAERKGGQALDYAERKGADAAQFLDDKTKAAGRFIVKEAPVVGEKAKELAVGAYNFAIGDDIKTLRDPHASALDKVLAGVSIASNFVGPEGKLAGRGLSAFVKIGEKALEHGGMELAVKEAEKLLGKEGIRAMDKTIADVGKFIEKNAPQLEKVLTKAANIAGAIKGFENVKEHVEKTITDLKNVFKPGASVGDRVKAAAECAMDIKNLVGDYQAIKKGANTIIGEKTTSVGQTRTEIKNAHGDDAERTRVGNHAFVETDHAIFDARGGKTMRGKSIEALGERAAHDTRPVIVIGKDLDHDTISKLGKEGVFVVKDAKAAKSLETYLRVPGVDRVKMLEQQFHASDIGQAYDQRKHMNTVRDTSTDNVRRVQDVRIGVGERHDSAVPFDHKLRVGTVTHVEQGRIEQFVGNGKYMTYSEQDLHGHVPKAGDFLEVHNNGRVVIQTPGHGHPQQVFDPQTAAQPVVGGPSR